MSCKNLLYPIGILIAFLLFPFLSKAQFPYYQSFKNITVAGMVINSQEDTTNKAVLTAASGIDPDGDGYLRLTNNLVKQKGYMYAEDSFPSTYGLTASFEFFTYRPDSNIYSQADGISFFLFDAGITNFRAGGFGGSLGYAPYYNNPPGMTGGYMGIGIDEYGNFSDGGEGRTGGIGRTKNSVVVRGPAASNYVYVKGVPADSAAFKVGFLGFPKRYPDSSSVRYRRIKIILTPGSSLGTNKGYTITVIMYKGGTSPVTAVTLINNLDYPYLAPKKLQFGFASSTGSNTDYHEIRNVNITATNAASLVAPTIQNDAASTCQGQPVSVDVTTNDVSNNTNGEINKATVDLDPSTSGIQTTYTESGKGVYTVDQNGLVTFTPVTGYSGTSVISYKLNDNYGVTATTSATITVVVNPAPSLTITNPATACAPSTVDITNPALRSNNTTGATYSYFSNLTDATNNTNNINSTANAISSSGTYYIRAISTSGCVTVKPIVVQINQVPTTANAGPDQAFCNATGMQTASFGGNTPTVGTGVWSQVSGPATASIVSPNSPTSSVSGLSRGVYNFRWSVSNSGCTTSTDDIQISVGGMVSSGPNQTLCTVTTATLQGSSPSPGTGLWTPPTNSGITINAPSSSTSTISGLVPGHSYVLTWTVTNGTCANSSEVTITDDATPVANAGTDQILCNGTATNLQANIPSTGTGTWTQVSGPAASIGSLGNPATAISGLMAGNTYVFRWTVTNGSCTAYSQMTVTDRLNTVADAGADQIVSSIAPFNLNGNIPGPGNTGEWTLLSAPPGSTATIENPQNPATEIKMVNRPGDYFFKWTITNGSCTTEDEVKVTITAILPVTFLSFRGEQVGEEELLKWQTATETDDDHFVVERSINGVDFSAIGTVLGNGTSLISHTYTYKDVIQTITAPVIYYKLAQVDRDGRKTYTPVLKVSLKTINPVQTAIWPNPFTDRLYVKFYSSNAGMSKVNLYDNTGRLIRSIQKELAEGYNTILLDHLPINASGLFVVEVATDKIIYRQKVVKK